MAAADPALPLAGDQARALEHRQMLRDRRQRHLVGRGQVADRAIAIGQGDEDLPPGRVGQGGEGLIETRGMLNHAV